MKYLTFLFVHFILLALTVFPQNQLNKTGTVKIGFVNPYAYDDKEKGVIKYVNAWNLAASGGFRTTRQDLFKLQTEAEKLQKEINDKSQSSEIIEEKQNRLTKLNERIKELEDIEKKDFEKRVSVFVTPIEKKIDAALRSTAERNNFILLKIDSELDRKIMALNTEIDITQKVIPALNEFFKTGIQPDVRIDLPETQILVINQNLFLDEKDGIKRFVELYKKYEKELNIRIRQEFGDKYNPEEVLNRIKRRPFTDVGPEFGKESVKIFKAISLFAKEKGFNVIFDANEKLPAELENFPVRDVTKEFISYYNQNNQ